MNEPAVFQVANKHEARNAYNLFRRREIFAQKRALDAEAHHSCIDFAHACEALSRGVVLFAVSTWSITVLSMKRVALWLSL